MTDPSVPTPRPRTLDGVAAGVLGIGLASLLAWFFDVLGWAGGIPSPLPALGAAFIDHTPSWLKDLAVQVFGTADKLALGVGMGLVVAALSAGLGALAARRLTGALLGFAGLVGVVLLAVLTRPGATVTDSLPTLSGGAVGLVLLRGNATDATAGGAGISRLPRRVLLQICLGVLALAAGLWGVTRRARLERQQITLPPPVDPAPEPAGADLAEPGVPAWEVPADEFYRIDTAIVAPSLTTQEWQLRVRGLVEQEITLDWEALVAKPLIERYVTLSCVSNEVGGSLVGNARWTGWPVRDLLAQARPTGGADMVLSRSVDGWTAGTPLTALTDSRDALLAVGMNGEPLPVEHGYPVRLVVPGLYGYVSATKWVTELHVTTFAADEGFWTPRGWSALGPIKTQSRIDVPRPGASVPAGRVVLAGVAWSPHRGIRAVQVQTDADPWQPAQLAVEPTLDAWRQWRYLWQATPGSHTVRVRAQDGSGQWQTGESQPPAPDGATGWHTVVVRVT